MAKKTQVKFPFGEYLKALREKKGASLGDVEKDTGIPNAYISLLETGDRRKLPDPDRMRLLADYYNVSVQELLEQAGYYESKDVPETYEKKIEKAFLHAVNDPHFNCGSKIKPKELSLDAKRFIVELYGHNVKNAPESSRVYSSGVFNGRLETKTLNWKVESVEREIFTQDERTFLRYRVKVMCVETEKTAWMVMRGTRHIENLDEKRKAAADKVTQTAIEESEFVEEVNGFWGYESCYLDKATKNALKKAVSKIKGADWASILKLNDEGAPSA